MRVTVNRALAISIHQQIKGAIEHEISFGHLGVGASLPSVRDLAQTAGVAPMTVSKVYAELKAAGLIEGKSGSGTYVAESALARLASRADAVELRGAIDGAIDKGLAMGLELQDVIVLMAARAGQRGDSRTVRDIVLVGLFEAATQSYADKVQEQVGGLAHVTPVRFDEMRDDPAVLARVAAADLVLTFSTLHDRLPKAVSRERIVSLRFIPSESTRLALASLDPMAQVLVVSRFADFLPVLGLGVRRFAAHVQSVTLADFEDAALEAKIASADVVVMSTGADAVVEMARPGTRVLEYRHIPDPGDIDRLVLPILTQSAGQPSGSRKEAS